ncbi:winged helix-turn-helix domain-containing protein [Pseudoalteromonas maricaloris]|uniref:winged helix-turn-helix domain-containing protein n=1 Tax=Pseudoalteromonas maricaloris TaxID=184924 RepID=UPI003C1AD1C1
MVEQYWVGDFFVDLSRNQISHLGECQTLAPKALAVLTCLAQNQGKVMSLDTLLDTVWPDTVVSPNTLQRSIAQLRKALGDDGKVQGYIQTHAKKGYSLECEVRWGGQTSELTNAEPQLEVMPAPEPEMQQDKHLNQSQNKNKLSLYVFVLLAFTILLGAIGYQYFSIKKPSPLFFDTLRSLTATDDKEFDASYSPDGQYIVFHRYLDKFCDNKIWAKKADTQQEILLTERFGAYGRHSFSKDGEQLLFLATDACSEPVTQKRCYDLVTLDFTKALKSPQQPKVILQCKNSVVDKPIWLNDGNVVLKQKQGERWKLINYSIDDDSGVDLYTVEDGTLIDYAYSPQDDLIAVSSIHADGLHYIDMLKPDGELISSHQIQLPPEITKFHDIYPSFDPLNQQLIFSTGRQLFSLTYEGLVSKIQLPFSDRMRQPEFRPDGKSVLMIKGPYDSDIVKLPLTQLAQGAQTYTSFARTNLGEDYAVFQPDGDLVAFWSERSGTEQVWLSDGNNTRQLTNFPLDTFVRGIHWAEDGQSILVSASGVLTRVALDGSLTSYPHAYPVLRLYQWKSAKQRALTQIRVKGEMKLAAYDFAQQSFEILTQQPVLWALESEHGKVVYKDRLDQFWQIGAVEPQRISALNNQGGRGKSFVMRGNGIYGVNEDNQLWSYDLDKTSFTILGEVPTSVDYLTDINDNDVLLINRISAKKEVVELTVANQ